MHKTPAPPNPLNLQSKDNDTSAIIAKYYEESEKGSVLSETMFSRSIWLFKYHKDNDTYYLSGLYKNGFLDLCNKLGYYKRFKSDGKNYCFIKDSDGIIDEVLPVHLKDDVFSVDNLIFEDLAVEYVDLDGNQYYINCTTEMLRETYLRHYHNVLNDDFLEHLETHHKPMIKDSRTETYLFFQNVIVKIDSKGFKELTYDSLGESCIWRSHILNRDFDYISEYSHSHYYCFISNISNGDALRIESAQTALGYLINNYCDPANTRAIICYDEEISDLKKPEGGTGKGLYANAIKQVRNVVKIDGKRFDPDDRFRYQSFTDTTQIAWIDDAPRKLGFEVFHSVLTDGWNVERKREHEIVFDPAKSPKLLITSNTVVEGDGNTNERRQFIIEFSNYYSKMQRQGIAEPVRHVHGCTFFDPEDWSTSEWNMFYSFIVDCCQIYLHSGLKLIKHVNFAKNKLISSTCPEFVEWIEDRKLELNTDYNTTEEFNKFKEEYFPDGSIKQNRFTDWLKKYANFMQFNKIKRKSNGTTIFEFKTVQK